MKKTLFFLFLPFITFSQVKYEAQLSYFNIEISQEVLLAAMPYHDSPQAETLKKEYNRPELQKTFIEYSAYEAYVQNEFYEEIKKALMQRFGITISSMVSKERGADSTAYGFPRVGTSAFKENSGFYFVKLTVKVGTLEGGPAVPGQAQDKTTLSPTIQMSLTLYDKKGKKLKKANAKYQSNHFVLGTTEDYLLWDGKTRIRGFKADSSVRDTFLNDLLKQGLGKLQESFYK